jgi:hypothetical protein
VTEKGVVQMPIFMPKPAPKVTPQPMEIVFLARPSTPFFEDLLPVDPGNTAKAPNAAARPKPGAYITEYCVAKAPPNYETGPLHILYSDGSRFTVPVQPKHGIHNPRYRCEDGNHEGFSQPQLADDRQTLGFLEIYDLCGQSYGHNRAVATIAGVTSPYHKRPTAGHRLR